MTKRKIQTIESANKHPRQCIENEFVALNGTPHPTSNGLENTTSPMNNDTNNGVPHNVPHDCKIFQDSVHGTIKMDPLLVAIIDTPQFQRLRDIKQLGASYWVFPGACHNRFEHCIGTSYLCGLMLTTLQQLHQTEYDNAVNITDTEILCVKIAGLCHDLGHGPFSHTFDGKFIKQAKPDSNWTHEQASCDLFDYMVKSNPDLKSFMERRGIGEDQRELIKRMIAGRDPRKDKINETTDVDGTTLEKWYLYEIVSNKRSGIDCDKFDYFARDTYHLGMQNSFSFMRFFQNVRILAVDNQLQICVRDKEMFNLYELFHVRWALHHQAYQHKSTKIIEEMICQALAKVDQKFGISSSIYDMERYTYLTDSVFYHILWSRETDPCILEAKSILKRVQQRKLYHLCGQINPNSTKRESEELSLSQPVTLKCDVIKEEIMEQVNGQLTMDDMYVDIISISCGMKNLDPVENVTFFSKDGKPKKLRRDHLSESLPTSYQEKHIRVYCTDDDKRKLVESAFITWCHEKGYLIPNSLTGNKSGYFTDTFKSSVHKKECSDERFESVLKNQSVKRTLEMNGH